MTPTVVRLKVQWLTAVLGKAKFCKDNALVDSDLNSLEHKRCDGGGGGGHAQCSITLSSLI